MKNLILSFAAMAVAASGQYKIAPAGSPPSELAPAVSSLLQKDGSRVVNAGGSSVCEVWFRTAVASGPKVTEDAVTMGTIPVGSLVGVIRFPVQGADRRGQTIKPGIYTLRYVLMPVSGDHLGAAPQRDFVAMIPAALDKDPASTPTQEAVIAMSVKATGTPHPGVLSIAPGSGSISFTKEAEHDWTLNTNLGSLPIAIILIGKAEA